ncbi:hypothetical protein CTM87_01135 [Photobacterium phosphoreum]|nr:hypothetical protein CTM87_01135 [Photobacterium phosphoreum]
MQYLGGFMSWSHKMGNMIKMLFGLASKAHKKLEGYEIQPKMTDSSVIKMDLESFRNSKEVKCQASAARKTHKQQHMKVA